MTLRYDTIKIRTWKGVEEHPVWRGQDFAIRDFLFEPGCEIIHIPSGFGIPARFDNHQQAERVMDEIQRMRNDWSCVDLQAIGPRMGRDIRNIVMKHNGLWLDLRGKNQNNLAAKVYDTKLNGYSTAH
jgi:hypothetical protein